MSLLTTGTTSEAKSTERRATSEESMETHSAGVQAPPRSGRTWDAARERKQTRPDDLLDEH